MGYTPGFSAGLRCILGYAAFLICVSPLWVDDYTGCDALVDQGAETTDLGQGPKQIGLKSQSIVLSNDSIYKIVVGPSAQVLSSKPKTVKPSRWVVGAPRQG